MRHQLRVVGPRVVHRPWLIRTCAIAASLAGTGLLAPGTAVADNDADRGDVAYLARSLLVWKTTDGHFEFNDENNNKSGCAYYLERLTDRNASPTLTFELEQDIPELKAGKHPWPDARPACAAITKAVEREDLIVTFARNADTVRVDAKDKGGVAQDPMYIDSCVKSYDKAIKAGIPPTEKITTWNFNDTLQGIYDKLCAPAKVQLTAATEEKEGPYRKVLKNDKLRIWLKDTAYIELGHQIAVTPEHLAAQKVWFEEASPERFCANGAPVHTLYRYQFDAQQKLVKESSKTYCDHPPDSAWR